MTPASVGATVEVSVSPEVAFEMLATMEGHHLDPVVCAALRDMHKAGRLADLLSHEALA